VYVLQGITLDHTSRYDNIDSSSFMASLSMRSRYLGEVMFSFISTAALKFYFPEYIVYTRLCKVWVLHAFSGCLHLCHLEEPMIKQTNLVKCNSR